MSQVSRWANERALVAITLLLIPVALLLSTQGLQFADLGGAFSPVFFPSIALWLWIGLATLNLISDAYRQALDNDEIRSRIENEFGSVVRFLTDEDYQAFLYENEAALSAAAENIDFQN